MNLAAWNSAMSLLISALLLWMYPQGQIPMHFSPLFKDKMYFQRVFFSKRSWRHLHGLALVDQELSIPDRLTFKGSVKVTIFSISRLSKKIRSKPHYFQYLLLQRNSQNHIIFNISPFKGTVKASIFSITPLSKNSLKATLFSISTPSKEQSKSQYFQKLSF